MIEQLNREELCKALASNTHSSGSPLSREETDAAPKYKLDIGGEIDLQFRLKNKSTVLTSLKSRQGSGEKATALRWIGSDNED